MWPARARPYGRMGNAIGLSPVYVGSIPAGDIFLVGRDGYHNLACLPGKMGAAVGRQSQNGELILRDYLAQRVFRTGPAAVTVLWYRGKRSHVQVCPKWSDTVSSLQKGACSLRHPSCAYYRVQWNARANAALVTELPGSIFTH